jgi:AraC family transcriptional activator of pobA
MQAEKLPIHHLIPEDKETSFTIHDLERTTDYNFSIPHRHSYYEIFFFEHGGGSHFVDFIDFPIHDYSVHFVAPGQVHMVRREPGSYGSVILFSNDFYHVDVNGISTLWELPFLNYNSEIPFLNLQEVAFFKLYFFVGQMKNELECKDALHYQAIHSWLRILLLQCSRLHKQKIYDTSSQENPLSNNMQKFVELLEKNFITIHRPVWYAEQFSMTEKHLNDIVKKGTGFTLIEKIQERILLEAKRLLLHSEMSFKEIGFALHFEDPSYFTRFFKRSSGQTPSEFRATIKKKYQL